MAAPIKTDRQKLRQAFKDTLANHVSQKGAILLKYTKDKQLHVSVSPHFDLEWKYVVGMEYSTHFFPGNKMMCRYSDGILYTTKYLGQFPSREAAEQRMLQLDRQEGASSSKKDTDKPAKRSKTSTQELPVSEKPSHLMTFSERFRLGLPLSGKGSEPPGKQTTAKRPATLPRPDRDSLDLGEAIASVSGMTGSVLRPLTPSTSKELPDDTLDEPSTYTELKAPYVRDTAGYRFVAGPSDYFFNTLTGFETAGCWMSQKSLVDEIGLQISSNELSKKSAELDNLRQKTCDGYGSIPEENLIASNSRRFSKEALARPPIIVDNSPKNHETTVFFPSELFGEPGAPGIHNSIYALEKGPTGHYDTPAPVPELPYLMPGAVLDTKGPFPYVTKLLLPDKVTDDLQLAQQKLPLFKDHVKWRTTDMPHEHDYYIPTRRTQEKDFTLKNPPRVNRSVITLRDSVSKWFFSIGGNGKLVLDPDYPLIFVDDHVHELYRKFLNREISLERFVWYLMSRMIGGGTGLYRLSTLHEIAKARDPKKRLNAFYEEVLGLEFFRAVENAVRRKVREILVSSGAPVSDAAVRQLPKVPQSFPAFFRHKMDSWMKGFCQRNEKTSGCSCDSSKNFESDGEDAAD